MAKTESVFLLFSCLLFQFLSVKSQKPLVPSLYVFGDSLVDSGNNNFLKTLSKTNYLPYGIDFPLGATGRFTNGKTAADFMVELLGLPFVPPYLGLKANNTKTTMGVNYASGSAGILSKTGTAAGDNICLDDQVKYFGKTLKNDLKNNFKSPVMLSNYLAKSIFMITIGSNDYINNYLQPSVYNSSNKYTPPQFANLLVHRLKGRIAKLYKYGARKFVVFGLGPLGCLPAVVNSANPKPNTLCLEIVNNYTLMFNGRLPGMIRQFNSTLPHANFVLGDVYSSSYDTNINPTKYGLSGGRTPCCVLGSNGLCLPNGTPCKDRTKNYYYDSYHPTQVVNNGVANKCFSGSSLCVPINVQQLARK